MAKKTKTTVSETPWPEEIGAEAPSSAFDAAAHETAFAHADDSHDRYSSRDTSAESDDSARGRDGHDDSFTAGVSESAGGELGDVSDVGALVASALASTDEARATFGLELDPQTDVGHDRLAETDDLDLEIERARVSQPTPSDRVRPDNNNDDDDEDDDFEHEDDENDDDDDDDHDDDDGEIIDLSGDNWIRGTHDDDVLDGGAGNDVVDGDRGDDTLIYDLGENEGATDYYDGGKGSDTLVIKMTTEQFAEHEAELADLENWMSENANEKRSESHGFNDASANSAKHPVYETSFGLTVRNIENLEIKIEDPEPVGVVIDLGGVDAPVLAPSAITTITAGTDGLSASNIDVALTPGSSISFSIDVNTQDLPSIYDVFMVQDLSNSFKHDLTNVQSQFSSLYDTLNADSNVNFGVGSFVDNPIAPFGAYEYDYTVSYDGNTYYYTSPADYVYNTDLAMTADKATLQAALDSMITYNGKDTPDSQLEALVQTALRDTEIGFRDGAQKFVVLTTDSAYHQAGDYATAPANNYDTVLGIEDYPDPVKTGELLAAAGITPIFAVTADQIATYQALVDSWGFGVVTEINADSSNLAAAVTAGINAASLDLSVSVLGDDYGYISTVTPMLYADVTAGTYTFDFSLDVSPDLLSYGSDSLTLEIPGYGTVNVNITLPSVDATGTTGDDTLIGDAGTNGLYGLAGMDTLNGAAGDDVLVGGIDNDMLTGGMGNDVFVFAAGDGSDVITDFTAGGVEDYIDLSGFGAIGGIGGTGTAAGFADVMALATQVGTDTVVDFGAGDAITLTGVTLADLTADDFIF